MNKFYMNLVFIFVHHLLRTNVLYVYNLTVYIIPMKNIYNGRTNACSLFTKCLWALYRINTTRKFDWRTIEFSDFVLYNIGTMCTCFSYDSTISVHFHFILFSIIRLTMIPVDYFTRTKSFQVEQSVCIVSQKILFFQRFNIV